MDTVAAVIMLPNTRQSTCVYPYHTSSNRPHGASPGADQGHVIADPHTTRQKRANMAGVHYRVSRVRKMEQLEPQVGWHIHFGCDANLNSLCCQRSTLLVVHTEIQGLGP